MFVDQFLILVQANMEREFNKELSEKWEWHQLLATQNTKEFNDWKFKPLM